MEIDEIKHKIINEIFSHYRLGAILYIWAHRLCCHLSLENPISETDFIDILLDMIKSKEIDIIIPDPFLIKWEKKNLNNLKFVNDGVHYVRKFCYINDNVVNNSNKNEPLIDTRKIDKKDKEILNSIAQQIKYIIKKFPEMKEKIILSSPDIKKPIKLHFIDNIYEINREEKIQIDNQKIKSNQDQKKNTVSLEEQEAAIETIKKYRQNFMCVYITLIETIQKELSYLQKYKSKIENYSELFKEALDAFKTYSILFAEETWTESSIPLQNGIKIKTGKLYYTSLNFKNDIFYIEGIQEYWALFEKKRNPGLKEFLLKQGYIEMGIDEDTSLTNIGLKLKLNFSINTIEQFFFLCKYLFIGNLFHLFFLINFFFKEKGDLTKLTEKKDNLSELFIPVLKPFFNINQVKPLKRIQFAFESVNRDELNILYNKFLFYNAREIEKRLRTFQLFYKSKYKKDKKE